MRAALATSILGAAAGLAGLASASCSVVKDVEITFYGWSDNSPPGDAVAYNCGGRNYHAQGSGTYDDPLTFATAPGEYSPCEIVYLPYLQKYLRMEDQCVQCESDWKKGKKHIDIWTGKAPTSCEDGLTPGPGQDVVRDPPKGLPVSSGDLWNGKSCSKSTHSGAAGVCKASTNTWARVQKFLADL